MQRSQETGDSTVAKMCPMSGCKANQGFCVHDWMMIAMVMMGAAAAVAHWGFHAF